MHFFISGGERVNYAFSPDHWMRIFAVPSSVAENYLKLASGNAVKVLLFIAYHNDRTYTTDEISEALGISDEMTEEALIFWKNTGVITDKIPDAVIPAPTEPTPTSVPKKEKTARKANSGKELTPREIAARVSDCEDVKILFTKSEECFGRVLTHTEQRSLVWMHDYLGLPSEILLMLIEYCKIHGKLNMRYIESVASDWSERDISTLELAEAEFARISEMTSFTGKIRSIFGISDRNLSSKEKKYIEEWFDRNYDAELISYAYDRTIDSTGKLSFAYLDKILSNWREKGIRDRLSAESETNPSKKEADEKPVYDFDTLENLALSTSDT